jgi:hypothetical protein
MARPNDARDECILLLERGADIYQVAQVVARPVVLAQHREDIPVHHNRERMRMGEASTGGGGGLEGHATTRPS